MGWWGCTACLHRSALPAIIAIIVIVVKLPHFADFADCTDFAVFTVPVTCLASSRVGTAGALLHWACPRFLVRGGVLVTLGVKETLGV